MRNEDQITFLKWTSNWLGIAPLTLFWRPILVEENPAFWPNPPFWTGFQPVSSLHKRRYFFSRFCRRAKASAKWVKSARQARRGRRRKNNGRPHTIVFLHSAPDIPLNGSPHSLSACIRSGFGLNCLRSLEKRTPVMQASQLAWYGNCLKKRFATQDCSIWRTLI